MRIVLYLAAWLIAFTGIAAAQSVGVTSAVNQSAVGLPPSQKPKTIFMGDQIIHNEKITTDSKGLLQILLADGTSFTVGPNSSMSIDSFVYDPDAGSAKIVASLGKGVFRFIGGKSSKSPDGVTLNTPVGTVGVRGGISNLDFSGATAYHVDMIYGDGITLKDGTQIIGNIYHSGYSIVIGTNGKVSVEKTPPGWAQQFQTLMAGQGGGDSDTSKQVADNVTKGAPGKPPGSPPGTPGDTTPPPTNGIIDTKKVNPIATWGQIENSSLATAHARYDGSYSSTTSLNGQPVPLLTVDDGPFALVYSFGLHSGTAYFGPDITIGGKKLDPTKSFLSLQIPVTADGSTGPATFSNDTTGKIAGLHVPTDLNGTFLNTSAGTAHGVAGTFDVGVGTPLETSGAFAGDYSKLVTPR